MVVQRCEMSGETGGILGKLGERVNGSFPHDARARGYKLGDWSLRNRCNLTATRTDSKSLSLEIGLMR